MEEEKIKIRAVLENKDLLASDFTTQTSEFLGLCVWTYRKEQK